MRGNYINYNIMMITIKMTEHKFMIQSVKRSLIAFPNSLLMLSSKLPSYILQAILLG